jgi:hypothetical protein
VPISYHGRYLAGDHVAVWRELIELGGRAYEPDVFEDALAVCREIVSRAATNLRLLRERLTQLGYQFDHPQEALVEAGPGADAVIQDFEAEFGELPLIARVWYRNLASVDFLQAPSQLINPRTRIRNPDPNAPPPPAPDVAGLGSHLVLRFWSLETARSDWHKQRAEAAADLEEGKACGGWPPDYPFVFRPFLCLGTAASNCEAKGFPLPCRGVDGVIYDDGAGRTYFVDELRKAFQWGGFPYWRRSLTDAEYGLPWEYRPDFARVLPILREGLRDL